MIKTKILAIDDEKDFLDALKTSLEAEGYEVATACDGEAGIKQAKLNNPDLIICDISMPKKDGFGVLKEIRQDRAFSRKPFIMLTALDDLQKAKEAYQDKADFYVTKPVDIYVLTKSIQTLLSLSKRKLD